MLTGKLFRKKDTSSFYNIVLFGYSESHKSALFRTFCDAETTGKRNNKFQFGIKFKEKEFKVSRSVATTLNIWNINGKIYPKDIVSQYCRGAHGVLLCYNPENNNSFDFIETIAEENTSLLSELSLSIQIVCISKKKKEPEKSGASQEEVKSIAKKIGAKVLNCSLDDSRSIDDAFASLVTDISKKCKIGFNAGSDIPPKPLTQPPRPPQEGSKTEIKVSPVPLISLCRYKGVEGCAKKEVKRNDDRLFGEYKRDGTKRFLYYRVSVLGNPRIGKSCFCARYLEGECSWKDESDCLWTRSFCLPNWIFLRLQMCEGPLPNSDTDPRLEDHFSRSHAVLLCYDITDRSSFEAVATVAAGVRAGAMGGAVVMVVGLRYDDKGHVEVPGEEGRALADANGMMFRECSAADNVGVREVFTRVLLGLQQADSFALLISVDDARRTLEPSVVPSGIQEDEEDPRLATLLDDIITENGLKKKRAREEEQFYFWDHEYDHLFKILLKGDYEAGKTCLSMRYADETFTDSRISTAGVDFKIRTMETPNNRIVQLHIWDLEHGERFRVGTSGYRGAHAAVLCFDTTNQKSFDNLKHWASEIDRYASRDVAAVIVGTKSDLPPVVDPVAAREFACSLGYSLLYCSSKTGEGVNEVFIETVASIGCKRGLDFGFDL